MAWGTWSQGLMTGHHWNAPPVETVASVLNNGASIYVGREQMKGNQSLQRHFPPLILVAKIIYYSSSKGLGDCLTQSTHFTDD